MKLIIKVLMRLRTICGCAILTIVFYLFCSLFVYIEQFLVMWSKNKHSCINTIQLRFYITLLTGSSEVTYTPQWCRCSSIAEGLSQGPYVVTRVGFEPPTFRTQGTKPTTEPPRPTALLRLA